MRNAIHADLQSQVERLIDTICLGFPVGEKMFWEKNFGVNFFWGKKIGGKQIWGLGGKKIFWKKFRENNFGGKTNLWEKKFFSRQHFFCRQHFLEKKIFLTNFLGKTNLGQKKFHRDRFSRLRETCNQRFGVNNYNKIY